MITKNDEILHRLEAVGKNLCGPEHGWKKKFAERIGITPMQLSSILVGRNPIGGIIQSRLRDAGIDVEYILTGMSKDEYGFRKILDTVPAGQFDPTHSGFYSVTEDIPHSMRLIPTPVRKDVTNMNEITTGNAVKSNIQRSIFPSSKIVDPENVTKHTLDDTPQPNSSLKYIDDEETNETLKKIIDVVTIIIKDDPSAAKKILQLLSIVFEK